MDDFKSRSPVASKSSNRASYTGTPLPSNIVEGRSSAGSSAALPSLLRRSSYEPLHGKAHLGLGALPPPTFSRAPPGQRSVPAIEYLGGKASNAMNGSPSNGNTATSRNSIDGSSSSSLPLGNGLMAAEPWNLWSDPSVPVSSSSPRSTSTTAGRNTRSPPHSATAHLDKMADSVVDDLASNIATTTLLDTDRLSKRSSKSSTSSATVPGDSAVWPQELSAAPAQPFALDPSASPSANLKASSSIDGVVSRRRSVDERSIDVSLHHRTCSLSNPLSFLATCPSPRCSTSHQTQTHSPITRSVHSSIAHHLSTAAAIVLRVQLDAQPPLSLLAPWSNLLANSHKMRTDWLQQLLYLLSHYLRHSAPASSVSASLQVSLAP